MPTIEPLSLRLLTYNTWFLPKMRDMLAVIGDINADIVCLQEVLFAHPTHPAPDQVGTLARELGYPHYHVNPNWRRIVGRSGNAIAARWPIESVELITDFTGHAYGIAAVFNWRGHRFAMVMLHLMWVMRPLPLGVFTTMPRRLAQVRQAMHWVEHCGLPCIVAGDFNVMPHWPEYNLFARRLVDVTRTVPADSRSTRPTWGLPVQLDYIFVTDHFQTKRCEIVEIDYSDHRPLYADLLLSAS